MKITGKNYQKILRELDLKKYPSLPDNLLSVREKLIAKQELGLIEKVRTQKLLEQYFSELEAQKNKLYVSKLNFSKFSHRPLLDFQIDGVKFLLLRNRAILADDTGLGKSIQAVTAALFLPESAKILIVTPRSLKYNIATEIEHYSNSFKVIEKTWEKGYKFTIVHYDSLKKWEKDILKEKFDCVISDESHLLKNSKTQRSKHFSNIIKDVERLWLLTGTPINNRPIDFYNLLKLIYHPLSKDWIKYVTRYCGGFQNHWGQWDVNGASNLQELHELTKESMLRRLKIDHLKELPNKNRQPIYLHLENIKGYQKIIDDYIKQEIDFKKSLGINIDEDDILDITKIMLWRKFCAFEKINDGSLIELIENNLPNKIVVFTNFTSVVDTVYNHFGYKKCRFIDGRIKDPKRRLEIIDEFQYSSELEVLVLNFKVGSVGLNIQKANIGIANDMDFVPSTMIQAEDRMWRMGQKNEVTFYYPIYKGTIEEVIFNIVNSKMNNISQIIEGKKEDFFDKEEQNTPKQTSVLQEIINSMK